MPFHVDPAELRALADRIGSTSSAIGAAAPDGDDVDGWVVGTDVLGAALGDVRRRARDRMDAIGVHTEETADYLRQVADSAEALDRALAVVSGLW